MGKKKQWTVKSKGFMKLLPGIFSLMLLAVLVLAAAPSTPTTITPANESIFLNGTITCSGSTDGDGDDFNYLLWYYYNTTETTLLQSSSAISFNLLNFAPRDSWETQCTGGQTCEFYEGLSLYRITSRSSGVTSLNFTNQIRFNMNDWYVEVYGDNRPKTIYIDGTSVWTSSATLSSGNVAKIDVSSYNDGALHNIIFNLESDGNGQQMYFDFEHNNATILCQAQDENNDYSGNLTYFYELPVFKACNESSSNDALSITFENENNTGTDINGTINDMSITLDMGDNDNGELIRLREC